MSAASQSVSVRILPDTVTASCRQCGKPGKGFVSVDHQSPMVLCGVHIAHALNHFTNAHRIAVA